MREVKYFLKKRKGPVIIDINRSNTKFSISSLDDNEIWNEFKKGNEGAFNYIFETYFQDLYQYGQQFTNDLELIKDMIQDLFIYIRKNRENLGNAYSIKFYLFKAFRRKILRYKKKNKLIYSDKIESFCKFQLTNNVEAKLIQDQSQIQWKRVLEDGFLRLSKRQKVAIYYYFYQSMSYEEVASIMNLKNIKSARNLIYKSIDVLKARINPFKNKLFTLFISL